MVSRPLGAVASTKGDPITLELAIELKQLLFGNANRDFPAGWKSQALEFNDRDSLKFGLVQHRGGPCGVLAAVQAFVIKYLAFPDDGKRYKMTRLRFGNFHSNPAKPASIRPDYNCPVQNCSGCQSTKKF